MLIDAVAAILRQMDVPVIEPHEIRSETGNIKVVAVIEDAALSLRAIPGYEMVRVMFCRNYDKLGAQQEIVEVRNDFINLRARSDISIVRANTPCTRVEDWFSNPVWRSIVTLEARKYWREP